MGVTSWTFDGDTAYVNMTSPTEIIANGATFTLTMPSTQLKANGPYLPSEWKYLYSMAWLSVFNGATAIVSSLQASTSSKVSKNVYAAATWNKPTSTITTSNIFNSTNANDKTIALSIKSSTSSCQFNATATDGSESIYSSSQLTFGTINLTLDVPPTATVSSISYDTGYVYAGLTTASVTISDAAAYYGGTISSVAFSIGNQTATSAGDGTLSIALANPGTFTPTVTVTDSRGQTKTYTLPAIIVNTYTTPTVSFDVDRTDATGTPDDEGTYGFIEATLTFSDVVATAVAPSVVLTDENGTQTTPVVSWYTDNALTTPVVWANVSSGDTVYGIFSGVNTNYSYSVLVRPRDSEGTGTAITQTISAAFYTVDFLAGGHGIAFGKPASNVGFECAMNATFNNPVICDDILTTNGVLTCNDDVNIDLPQYQTSGIDKDIYDMVVSLGWDSDVLTGNVELILKELINKLLSSVPRYKNKTPSITKTAGGTIQASTFCVYGRVVMLAITVNYNTSVAAGSNFYTGTLNEPEKPIHFAVSGSYYGNHSIGMSIDTSGNITLRNSSATAISMGTGTVTGIITYII